MKRILASTVVALPLLVWSIAPTQFVVAQAAPPAANSHPEMPPGPGKDIALKACTKCHAITNVTSQKKDNDGWTATITKMVGYGATGTDEEFQTIVDYLTANFGPTSGSGSGSGSATPTTGAAAKIDVNKETAAQLTADLGLTDDEAKAVVAYRNKNGSFKTIDDLKKVPAVDAKKIDAKKDSLLFS